MRIDSCFNQRSFLNFNWRTTYDIAKEKTRDSLQFAHNLWQTNDSCQCHC
jgi:hypothetical protein